MPTITAENSIPYGLLVRAKRICTEEEHFVSEARSIIQKLRERKYPESILERAVKKILEITRQQLLEPKITEEDIRIRFVTTYNPSNHKTRSPGALCRAVFLCLCILNV